MTEINGKKISGYLQKRGEKGLVKGFKKRWFVFNGEPERKVYYYLSREDMAKELGFISLDQITEIRKTSVQDFEVVTPSRIYYLQAPTDKVVDTWIGVMKPKEGGVTNVGSSELLQEKDATIARLRDQVKLLEGEGGGSDTNKIRDDLIAAREELENLKKNAGGGGDLSADMQKKEQELKTQTEKMNKMEENFNEELVELKKEYFRACAIGIVQQRKITKDLPPVAELYKRCLDDNTEWRDYVPWIKTTLPKK